jgi:hypothetical protein
MIHIIDQFTQYNLDKAKMNLCNSTFFTLFEAKKLKQYLRSMDGSSSIPAMWLAPRLGA